MDWIRCNNCFTILVEGKRFFVSNCGVMLCVSCFNAGDGSLNKCSLCNKKFQITPLSPEHDRELRNYFCSTSDYLKMINDIIQFQGRQKENFLTCLSKLTMELEEENRKLEIVINQMKKDISLLEQKLREKEIQCIKSVF